MRKSLLALNFGAALATLATTSVLAQESSRFMLEEVVVTAQKRAESSQDVPISIQAFSADGMEKLGATELFDLAKSAPSLSTGGVPGSNQTSGIRGVVDFSRNIGIDARMGVYIDGIYQGRSSSANQPLLGLESVEILRGPQGTLFGKNTVSGAINLNTRKASDEFSGELKAGLGSEGYLTGSALLSGPLGDTVFGSIAYSKQQRDGYFDNTALNKTVGDWEQEGARGQLRFLPSDQLEIILAGDYGSTDSEIPVYTRASLPAYTTGKSEESDKVDFWGTALTINYNTESDYTLSSISAYRENEYTLIGDEDFTAAVEAFQTTFDEDGDQFSQEFRIISPEYDSYDWVAGLYYFESSTSTGRNITLSAPILPTPAVGGNIAIPSVNDVTSYAAYIHGNYRLTEKLELTAGLRYTNEEKEFDFNQVNNPDDPAAGAAFIEAALGLDPATAAFLASQAPGSLLDAFNLNYKDTYSDSNWSPTLGINYLLNDDVMFYAKYSRGHQSGGFNGDFNPYLPAIQFDSEYVDAYELGIKSTLADGAVRFNADVFVQKYSDFQLFQRVPVGNSSVQIVSNAGEATSQGVELETVWLPTDTLQLTLNATYLDATYDTFENPVSAIDPTQPADFNGNDLNYAPKWKLYAGVQYILPLGGAGELTFNVDYTYQDDMYSDAANDDELQLIPSYDLWNGRVTFNPTSDRWQVSAWIQNIADDEYIINHSQASLTGIDRVIWGAPQLYGMEFKYFLGQ
ncbi:TonB-dependent receptor [Porticoccaceae bacterium]|nr:TonB-dependent receptor [Porticoccaceae bacterium]MDC0003197.1 TonB-dependent receptor [Porticoccaceae bacterium]